MVDVPAQLNLRKEYVDGAVKGFAEASYKFKQGVTITPTTAWKNYFFRETSTPLTAQSGNAVKGIPRGAEFPQASVSWTKVTSVIEKYGMEDNIPWEDLISDDVDVRDRTLMRIGEAVAKAVDDEIWSVLTESQSPSAIQEVAIASGSEWDTSSAAIFDNIGQAKQKLGEYNYPTTDLLCFISPKDQRSIDTYIYEKGAQAPKMGEAAAMNGSIGKINGVTFVVSNSVTASYALVVVPKRCATWKAMVPLQTTTKEDPYKSVTIRAVEMGVTQLTDPKACVLISNTQSP
jgi:hypothetical protein